MKYSEIINFKVSHKTIIEIEEEIKSNFNDLQNAIQEDNKFFGESLNFKNILSSINLIKNENWNFKLENQECIYTSSGNIAVLYEGNPDIAVYLMLKAVKTNNNLVLFEDSECHKSTKIILNIINKILKKNNLSLIINSKVYKEFEEIVSYKEFFNKYICIGSKEKYDLLKSKVSMPIIYNAYGTMLMYLEDKSNKQLLIEIDSYVFNHNIKLNLYKGEIDDTIMQMNKTGHNFMLLIFSNDKEKIKKMVEKVNVKNICINKNPFINDYILYIEDNDFLERKKLNF